MKVTTDPFDSEVVLKTVTRGGKVTELLPFGSVTVIGTADENVESGWSVIVLVEVVRCLESVMTEVTDARVRT